MSFNPIKEDAQGRSLSMIWNTNVLNTAIKGLNAGKKLVANPFYDNKIQLLKGDLNFQRTDDEVQEWRKCKNDILYFANKYCKLMTPEGIKNIVLRDYQEEYLEHLIKNRLSIFISCRQSGKCILYTTCVDVKFDNSCQQYKKQFKKYHINNDIYKIPLFELYNLCDKSFKWKIKYKLYKLLYKLLNYEKDIKKKD